MAEQILTETSGAETALSYKIDGVDFKNFGVYVSKSTGFFDGLTLKESQKTNWDGEHGEVIDLSAPRYNSREIVLECFISANGKLDFHLKVKTFLAAFYKPDLRKLEVVISNKPLIYMIYTPIAVDVEKKWNDGQMIGSFKLTLKEPQPIKRLLVKTGMSVSVTFTSNNPLNIYWGDGTKLLDTYGTAQTKTHTYATSGTYYILITGVIEEISNFTTNADVVWSKY
jgi:hypothetical protein